MSEYEEVKVSGVTTIANFRDVSNLVKALKPGLLFRSGHIDDANRGDLDILRERYSIRSVIDLRGMQPWPFVPIAHEPGNYAQQYPDHIASTSILGLRLHFIDLYGPQYRRYMFDQVNLWDKAKSIARVALSPAQGYKKWQVLIAARESEHRMFVPETALDQSLPQIKAVFKVLADSSSYPILILNKYGGETVSVIVSLVLFLLRADMQSIHHDYMQSYQDLAGLKEQILEGIRESGMTDDYAEPFLPFVNSLEQHIQDKHGGIEQYLLKCGLDETELQAIKRTLLSTVKPTGGYDWLIDV